MKWFSCFLLKLKSGALFNFLIFCSDFMTQSSSVQQTCFTVLMPARVRCRQKWIITGHVWVQCLCNGIIKWSYEFHSGGGGLVRTGSYGPACHVIGLYTETLAVVTLVFLMSHVLWSCQDVWKKIFPQSVDMKSMKIRTSELENHTECKIWNYVKCTTSV